MTSNLLENTTKGLVQHQVWTNSTVCLNWPQEGVKYKQLVSNRVKKINEKKYTWRYVPTEDNPADIGNRGGSNLQANNKWMKGPTWLGTPELWPAMIVTEPSKNSDSEKQLVKEIMQVSVEREVDVIDERETWRAGVRKREKTVKEEKIPEKENLGLREFSRKTVKGAVPHFAARTSVA
eukprot:gene17102-18824_t